MAGGNGQVKYLVIFVTTEPTTFTSLKQGYGERWGSDPDFIFGDKGSSFQTEDK